MEINPLRLFQKYLVKPALVPFYTHLFKLSLRGMGILNSEGSHITGETWLMQHIKDSRIPIKTIVDVGANTGGYTQELLSFFPKAKVYCFEPNPQTYQMLLQTHSKHKNVHPYNLAVSHKSGSFKLFDYADDAPLKPTQPTATMASHYQDVIEELHHQPAKSYTIKSTTLDHWTKKTKINSIDWLKIDTEGHELSVLKGASSLISSHKINLIQFEFNDMNAYSHTFLRDIIKILPSYSLYRLLPDGWYPLTNYRPLTHELFGFQNIVAIPSNHKLN